MMFAKVSSGKSKESILKELIAARKSVQRQDTERILQEEGFEDKATKLFKPLVEKQREESKKTREALQATTDAISQIQILPGHTLRAITEGLDKTEPEEGLDPVLGHILSQVQRGEFPQDKAKGIKIHPNGSITLGSEEVKINRPQGYIEMKDKKYGLTDGLLYLLTTTLGNPNDFTEAEMKNYVDMLFHAKLLHKKDGTRHGWKGDKYLNIVKPFIQNYPDNIDVTGSGIVKQKKGKVVDVIVGSTEELLDQLQLALASIQAGNTSTLLKNKAIAILNNLFKAGKINKSTYIEALQHVD